MGSNDDVLAAVTAARSGLPPLIADDALLAAHVAAACSEAPLETLQVADLVLARACAEGDPAALAHFQRAFHGDVEKALGRMGGGADFVDEITQMVHERLFVGDRPRILEYRGRGTLRAWLRAVVMRTALNARRRKATDPTPGLQSDAFAAIAALGADEATLDLVRRFGGAYKQAVHDALSDLTPQDRNVLRLALLEGVGIDALGTMYGVHRATAARWIVRAQRAVADGARRRLGALTGISEQEVASVARACHEELSLSLVRALEEGP